MEERLVPHVFGNIYQEANLLIVTIILCYEWSTNLSISFSTVSHLSLFLFFYLHIPSSAIKGGKNPSCEIISFSFVFLYTHMPFSPSFLLDTKETRQKVWKRTLRKFYSIYVLYLNHPLQIGF